MEEKKYNININDTIENLLILRNEVSNSKQKRKIDKTIDDFKKMFNKLYYYAFYDYRFMAGNSNKIIDDLKNIHDKKGLRLIFIKIPELILSVYNEDSTKKESILKLIIEIKELIKQKPLAFKTLTPYIIDDFIIVITNKKNTQEIYDELKKLKNNYPNLNGHIYYTKYEKISSKINKNINICITNVLKVTKEKNTDENYQE